MSLLFTDASGDNVDYGSGSSLDQLNPLTVMVWVYPTATTDNRRIWDKRNNAAAVGKQFRLGGGGTARVELTVWDTGGGSAILRRSNDNGIVVNVWNFYACVINSTGPVGKILRGTLTAAATELTYSVNTNSGVAFSDDSAFNLRNGGVPSSTLAFPGRIGPFAYVNAQLTDGQIWDWQFHPRNIASCKLFAVLGSNGTNVPDWSGNNNAGTVTGASVVRNPPTCSPMFTHAGAA